MRKIVELYYNINFLVSLMLLMAYIFIYHKHFDVHITAIFLLVPFEQLGYVLLSGATNLETAVTANKLCYVGGVYLMFDVMLIVFSLCDIRLSKWLRVLFMAASSIIYISALNSDKNTYFYKSITFTRENGVAKLTKEYAFMHTAFYVIIFFYFALSIWAMVYAYLRKRQVSRKIIQLLMLPVAFSLICFFVVRRVKDVEMLPIAYNVALISYLMIIHRLCLYDITDTAIDSLIERGDTGFASFDFGLNYLGSNETACGVFPEFEELTVDKPLARAKNLDSSVLSWLTEFSHDNGNNKFYYNKNDRVYLIIINFLYDGKHKRGYQLEITDDTKNQQYISLLNRYNNDLQEQVAQKTRHIIEMHDNLIISMATMVESRDNSTGGHIKRTSKGVRILVDEIRREGRTELSDEFCKDLIKAAPMHDLGKIAVPDDILKKPARFTPAEFEQMKMHAAEGAKIVHEILKDTDDEYFMQIAENVAHFHHERWDGSGYPEGLKGLQIPLEARIMAIADVYDALVSKRVYKEKMSFEQADSIIMEGMGKHFDKALESAYVNARPRLEEYYSSLEDDTGKE